MSERYLHLSALSVNRGMKTWHEFHTDKRLNESSDDLMVKAYHAMSPADKEKVSKVLASPTWGDSWMNAVRASLNGKDNLPPQELARIALDGIDTYLGTGVSSNSQNSGRMSRSATHRQPVAAHSGTQARADYQGNHGRTQTLWGSSTGKHGAVPQEEITSRRLNRWHHDVYDGPGGLATAPSSYKYVWNRRDSRIVYNPNYAG